jgi:hypothetical protein
MDAQLPTHRHIPKTDPIEGMRKWRASLPSSVVSRTSTVFSSTTTAEGGGGGGVRGRGMGSEEAVIVVDSFAGIERRCGVAWKARQALAWWHGKRDGHRRRCVCCPPATFNFSSLATLLGLHGLVLLGYVPKTHFGEKYNNSISSSIHTSNSKPLTINKDRISMQKCDRDSEKKRQCILNPEEERRILIHTRS